MIKFKILFSYTDSRPSRPTTVCAKKVTYSKNKSKYNATSFRILWAVDGTLIILISWSGLICPCKEIILLFYVLSIGSLLWPTIYDWYVLQKATFHIFYLFYVMFLFIFIINTPFQLLGKQLYSIAFKKLA